VLLVLAACNTRVSEGAPAAISAPNLTASVSSSVAPPVARPIACLRPATCKPPAAPGKSAAFAHTRNRLLSAAASPRHRGRDQIVAAGDPQWVVAKMGYGDVEKDLEDEEVDVYVLRGCAGAWELVGGARTSKGDGPPPVEGVPDGGGRVAFRIPAGKELPVGHHPVRVVVKGDGSVAELALAVTEPKTPVFVSDVDGTLTGSEVEDFPKLLQGEIATTHDGAPEALQKLADKGYLPVYLTARPEFLILRTREFLRARGFPEGIVRTTMTKTGFFGDGAASWKSGELAGIAKRGAIGFGFGNMKSDTDAYDAVGILPKERRVFFQLDDAAHGGRRIESYRDLEKDLAALPDACARGGP